MKALILNGARADDDPTNYISEIVQDELRRAGLELRAYILRHEEIAACRGCFGCWIKTPGVCAIDDAAQNIVQDLVASDLVVLISPITFGGYSFELKKAFDRMIPTLSPFFMKFQEQTRHKPRYKHYPRMAGIGVLLEHEDVLEEIFKAMVAKNAINFHAPGYSAEVIAVVDGSERIKEEVMNVIKRTGAFG